jgi:hypothetical protein
MKKSLLYIATALLSASALSSCDDNFELPPLSIPTATIEPNTTISEFKAAFYKSDNNYANEVGTKADGSNYIIHGIVISSDESGNYFKQVVIDDGTSAIQLDIDAYDLYESYQVGQDVVIDATGLYAGAYGRLFQLGGAPSSGYPSRVAEATFAEHAQVNGLTNLDNVKAQTVTIEELDSIKENTTAWLDWQCRLVTINNVSFVNAGKETLATSGSNGVSQTVTDANGKTIIVYTSGYSDFYDYACPTGTGNITAILSCYNTNWQLRLISIDGLQGFDPLTKDVIAPIYSEAFTSSIGQFQIVDVTTDSNLSAIWTQSSSYGMVASGYSSSTKANYDTESWLVSPEINLAGASNASVSFDQAMNYFTSLDVAKEQASFLVRESGKEWSEVTGYTFPSALGWTFVNSGDIDLTAYLGKTVQFAFRYKSTSAKAGTWELKNFQITSLGGSVGSNPGK